MSLLCLGSVELMVDVFLSAHGFIIINNKHQMTKIGRRRTMRLKMMGKCG